MSIIDRVTPYRLTLLGVLVALVYPVPVMLVLGKDPKDYIVFIGPALGVVIAVFRGEQNALQTATNHSENQQTLSKLVYDNEAFRKALQELQKPDSTVADAARVAVREMPPPPEPHNSPHA
jgi:Na+-transporting NADH:ubiquinone oxidoreductase subunit NqrA